MYKQDQVQTTSQTASRDFSVPGLSEDQKASICKGLVDWIINHKRRLALWRTRFFKNLCKVWTRCIMCTHDVLLVEEIKKRKIAARCHFMEVISSIPGKVALTCDGLSSRVMPGYLVVTLHWIDIDWMQRSALPDFKYFPPLHNIHKTGTQKFNLVTKAREITTDSGFEIALAMKLMMQFLMENYYLGLD